MNENEKKLSEALKEEDLEQVSGGYIDFTTTPQCPKHHARCTKDNCLNANCGFLTQTQLSYCLHYTCGKNISGYFNIHL